MVDFWNPNFRFVQYDKALSPCRFHKVEGGLDVLYKFKANQKEGFRQAAPVIHDLVMDVVRSTGGEIPCVIGEDGYMAYIGDKLKKIDDVKTIAPFARDSPHWRQG